MINKNWIKCTLLKSTKKYAKMSIKVNQNSLLKR